MNIKEFIITPDDENNAIILLTIVQYNLKTLEEAIHKALTPLIFDNLSILHPKQLTALAEQEANAFLEFLNTKNINVGVARGREAAVNGLDDTIILTLLDVLHTFFLDHIPEENHKALRLATQFLNTYMKSYLRSFNQGQYTKIYKNQEQLYESLLEIVSRQREELLQKEKEENKKRKAFLLYFAHETKFPLTVIQNQISMVKEESGMHELKTLTLLDEQIKILLEMIINILDSEKIERGEMLYIHDDLVNVSTIAASKIELFHSLTKERNIRVTSDIAEKLYIRIDHQALDRILNNIIDNAIKYNRENGSIHISLKEDDDSVHIIVRDTGIGIPDDQKEFLFTPYYQGTNRKRKILGIGAGLPIVKSILSEVGGSISIKSRENEGTSVTITFRKEIIDETSKDMVLENVELSRPISRENINLKQGKYDENKKTILLVEDETELILYIQKYMNRIFNFYFAKDGTEALDRLKVIPKPDVIISDIMMSPMDGYEFYSTISVNERLADVPFIFLTAKASPEARLEGLKRGVIDYICKPFLIEEVIAKINAILRNREMTQDTESRRIEDNIIKVIRKKGDNKFLTFEKKCEDFKISLREKDVLRFILDGLQTKEIAEKLFLSEHTVRKHVRFIYGKCEVQNRVELVNLFKD